MTTQPGLGAGVRSDLDSTPMVLSGLLDPLDDAAGRLAPLVAGGRTWLVGCGSSHLVGGAVAEVLGRTGVVSAEAVPASELLDGPPGPPPEVALLVSRSGRTSETVAAAETLRASGTLVVAVVCAAASPLAGLADQTVELTGAGESGVPQTRSVAAALTLGLLLAARATGRDDREALGETLDEMERERSRRAQWAAQVADRTVARGGRVHLFGGGARWWLAREIALKGWEMGRADARAERVLEVPHGPVEALDGRDTVVVLAGRGNGRTRALESAVVDRLGDLVCEIEVLDPATPVPLLDQLHVGHHLALALAVAAGVDADAPERLTPHVEWTTL